MTKRIMSLEKINQALFKPVDADCSMTTWLKNHGSLQLFRKSCVASSISTLMLQHHLGRGDALPTDNISLMHAVLELHLYAQIADPTTKLADPLKLFACISELGEFTVSHTEHIERELEEKLDALSHTGIKPAPFKLPVAGQCFIKIENDHATLVYSNKGKAMLFDAGISRKDWSTMGSLREVSITSFKGLAIHITFNPSAVTQIIATVYKAFHDDQILFFSRIIASLNLSEELSFASNIRGLLFAFQGMDPELRSYIILSHLAHNKHLKTHCHAMLSPKNIRARSLTDQLSTLSTTAIPSSTLESRLDKITSIITWQFINTKETRDIIRHELTQPFRESALYHITVYKRLFAALGDEYTELKAEMKAHLFSEITFTRLSCSLIELNHFLSLSEPSHADRMRCALEKLTAPENCATSFTTISNVIHFLEIAQQYATPEFTANVIDTITTTEPMRTRCFKTTDSEKQEQALALATAIDPKIADIMNAVFFDLLTVEIRPASPALA